MGILKGLAELLSPAEPQGPRDLGRNDVCWCGSGKKYKKCHLDDDERRLRAQKKIVCGRT